MLHHPFTNWIYIFQLINRISTPTEIYISMKSFHMTLKPKRTKNRSTIFTFNLSLITFLAYGFSYIKTFYMFNNLTFITNSTSSINYVVCVIFKIRDGTRTKIEFRTGTKIGVRTRTKIESTTRVRIDVRTRNGVRTPIVVNNIPQSRTRTRLISIFFSIGSTFDPRPSFYPH